MNINNTISDDLGNSNEYLSSRSTKKILTGNSIYRYNQKAEKSFIILAGEVETSIPLKTTNLYSQSRILKKGATIGLIDVLLGRNYSRSMTALSTCIVAEVTRNEFKSIFKSSNLTSFIFLKSLALAIENTCPGYWS